jgi:hypothetical protein
MTGFQSLYTQYTTYLPYIHQDVAIQKYVCRMKIEQLYPYRDYIESKGQFFGKVFTIQEQVHDMLDEQPTLKSRFDVQSFMSEKSCVWTRLEKCQTERKKIQKRNRTICQLFEKAKRILEREALKEGVSI